MNRTFVSTPLTLASGAVLATALASCSSSSNPAGDPIDAGSDDAVPDAAPEARPMLADYAAPMHFPQGDDGIKRIDVEGTLDRLAAAHINTYAYLIYGSGEKRLARIAFEGQRGDREHDAQSDLQGENELCAAD